MQNGLSYISHAFILYDDLKPSHSWEKLSEFEDEMIT